MRQRALVDSLKLDDVDFDKLDDAAKALTRMARYYGYASRTATVAKPK